MKAKGDFGKEHPPINASVQKRAIQRVLRYSTKSLKMIGSGTSYRFPPQTHDDERDEKRGQSIALNLFKLRFRTILPIPHAFMTTKSCFWACSLTDKTLVSSFKLSIFASVTVFLFSIVNQLFSIY